MRQVAVNIRWARKERGETQESFARALDVTLSCVQGWENDGRIPGRANLAKLEAVTGHKVAWFFTEHDMADHGDRVAA